MQRMVTIYGLREPGTTEIRYVGTTRNERLALPHLVGRTSRAWAETLSSKGLRPEVVVFGAVTEELAATELRVRGESLTERGDRLLNTRGIVSEAKLFWTKVDKHGPIPAHAPELGPCWIWQGCLNRKGYGRFRLEGAMRIAHRVSYRLTHGTWPPDLCCHHCDNPSCVNPRHIYNGTHGDNTNDMRARGRMRGGHASLSQEQVAMAVRRSQAGDRYVDIARDLGCDRNTVSEAVRRHAGAAARSRRKVFASDKTAIVEALRSGARVSDLAKQFGVHSSQIYRAAAAATVTT